MPQPTRPAFPWVTTVINALIAAAPLALTFNPRIPVVVAFGLIAAPYALHRIRAASPLIWLAIVWGAVPVMAFVFRDNPAVLFSIAICCVGAFVPVIIDILSRRAALSLFGPATNRDLDLSEAIAKGGLTFNEREVNRRIAVGGTAVLLTAALISVVFSIYTHQATSSPGYWSYGGVVFSGLLVLMFAVPRQRLRIDKDGVTLTSSFLGFSKVRLARRTAIRRLKYSAQGIAMYGHDSTLLWVREALFSPNDIGLLMQYLQHTADYRAETDVNMKIVGFSLACALSGLFVLALWIAYLVLTGTMPAKT